MNFKKTVAAYQRGAKDVDVTFTDELERTGEVASDSQSQDIEFEDDDLQLVVHVHAIVEPAIESGDEEIPSPVVTKSGETSALQSIRLPAWGRSRRNEGSVANLHWVLGRRNPLLTRHQ